MRVAGFDIGTNTVRAVVLERSHGDKWETVRYIRKVTRLGEGLSRTGVISKAALDRTIRSLIQMVEEVRAAGVSRICAGATYSLRTASNSQEVLREIEGALGARVKIISSRDEARLMAEGIFLSLPRPSYPVVCVDIGGGSTELARVENGRVTEAVSLDVGVVTLTENFLSSDPPASTEILALENFLIDFLKASRFPLHPSGAIYGNCGTFSTLAMMVKGMFSYSRKFLHGCSINKSDFEKNYVKVVNSTKEERLKMPGVERGREDVIVAGFCFLKILFDITGALSAVVSEDGWLEAFTVRECGGC